MECNIGFSYFFGIGKPRNLTTAFEKFLEGAESGDTESMYMLSMCYSESLGTDKDEGAARAWLEKAATCGNPNAMTELAVILMNSVDHRDPQLLADVLRSIVTQEPQSTARKPPVYPKTRKPETDTSYIDDEVNAIDRVEERFSQNSRQWLRRNSATNIDAQRKGITGASTAADRRPSDALSPFSPSRRRASESDYQGSPAMEDKSNDFNEFDETEETQAQIREREEADLQMAVKLLLQAAERNFATAMTNLGNAFEVAGDFVHAAKW
jgi:TPR repeat protein